MGTLVSSVVSTFRCKLSHRCLLLIPCLHCWILFYYVTSQTYNRIRQTAAGLCLRVWRLISLSLDPKVLRHWRATGIHYTPLWTKPTKYWRGAPRVWGRPVGFLIRRSLAANGSWLHEVNWQEAMSPDWLSGCRQVLSALSSPPWMKDAETQEVNQLHANDQ